jgi:hypothetical protein
VSEVIVIILKGFQLSNKKNSKSYTDIIISKGFFTYMIYGKINKSSKTAASHAAILVVTGLLLMLGTLVLMSQSKRAVKVVMGC